MHAKPISLRDKIGQMLMIGFKGDAIDEDSPIIQAISDNNLGGVILYDRKLEGKNVINLLQVQTLNQRLQNLTHVTHLNQQRPDLPLLIGQLPLSEADTYAATMAQTLKTAGFNLNFAPVVDLNLNPDNPIIGKLGRSFSDNPSDVINYADLFSHHFLSQGIQCAYKHFPGHGSSRIRTLYSSLYPSQYMWDGHDRACDQSKIR